MTRAAPVTWRCGMATDIGLQRSSNEDRTHVNEADGVFLVVDGMGGHAAGEKAAQAAVEIIPRRLESLKGSAESRIRQAIAAANNEIYRAAQAEPGCAGMACVLTLAVAHDDKLTVGHVGDSRLYLAWAGALRKLTSDHSPVGEREDRGDLTEAEAMRDPRRNVVFRDVGSRPHEPLDDDFIETRTYPFHPDAAFLLCTDGLSDVLTSVEMNAVVQRYDGDAQHTAEELVEAANRAGGKDNVSVVFVAGPGFAGAESPVMLEARSRHSITRFRRGVRWKTGLGRLLWLLGGAILGAAGWVQIEKLLQVPPTAPAAGITRPHRIAVDASDPHSLQTAVAASHEGDLIQAPAGTYSGPINLKDGIDLVSLAPGQTAITSNTGPAIVARNITAAGISGFRLAGLSLVDSTIEADEIEVTGATGCGIQIEGRSPSVIRAAYIHDNSGCAVRIGGGASPRLIGNRVSGAIEVQPPSQPILLNNLFENAPPADLLHGNFVIPKPREGSLP
jgi:serine/threonine protein phosphatase PrpC